MLTLALAGDDQWAAALQSNGVCCLDLMLVLEFLVALCRLHAAAAAAAGLHDLWQAWRLLQPRCLHCLCHVGAVHQAGVLRSG